MTSPGGTFLSRAQNLEDIVLWRTLGQVRNGCYIDIGASHPHTFSVSRGFYDHGWRGTHFEPLPTSAALLRADRPDETVYEVALSDFAGTIDFHVSPIEGRSTAVAVHAGPQDAVIQVQAATLSSFDAHWSGTDVHWMKIDVEGMEAAVLRGWNPTTLRPWVLVIEATRPDSPEPNHFDWEPLVFAAGYQLALFDGLNRFYIANEHEQLRPRLAAPANVFDFAQGCQFMAWRGYGVPESPASFVARMSGWLRRALSRMYP